MVISEITSRLKQFVYEKTGKPFIVARQRTKNSGFQRIVLGPGQIYSGVQQGTFVK